ncbi:hypothetical protein DPMN_033541 [Dreissena polymorpha]|uniref:Uncharacterized protein n=1 Tax=Dreissena polymorpha TaxID=45954 RepID=A0A9D4J5E9_DREPO|nr:hypothetical protein DPMN_152718 [Dreissena polymorpha]KAH3870359.1 hypothetical protein DPMN_033541 [Dreissena polymorpha]
MVPVGSKTWAPGGGAFFLICLYIAIEKPGIRTISPTDNRSYAKFDRADGRSYDVLTGRTVAPTMFCKGGQSLLRCFDRADSRSYIILPTRTIAPTLFCQPRQSLLHYFDSTAKCSVRRSKANTYD